MVEPQPSKLVMRVRSPPPALLLNKPEPPLQASFGAPGGVPLIRLRGAKRGCKEGSTGARTGAPLMLGSRRGVGHGRVARTPDGPRGWLNCRKLGPKLPPPATPRARLCGAGGIADEKPIEVGLRLRRYPGPGEEPEGSRRVGRARCCSTDSRATDCGGRRSWLGRLARLATTGSLAVGALLRRPRAHRGGRGACAASASSRPNYETRGSD